MTLITDAGYITTAPFFPLGLLAIFPGGASNAIKGWMLGVGTSLLGWTIYIALSVVMARTRTRAAFTWAYIDFCVILALNVARCQKTTHALHGIQ